MIVTQLSSSSINTFDSCPMSWFIKYNLKWPDKTNKAAVKGNIVHEVLEILARIKKEKQNNKRTTYINENKFENKNYLNNNDLIPKLTNDIFEQHQQKNSDLKWNDQDNKDCIDWAFKVINSNFDPRKKEVVDAENYFKFEMIKPWSTYKYIISNDQTLQGFLQISGIIDLVIQQDNGIEIIDYKTGKRKDWNTGEKKTSKTLKKDIQARLYHYMMSKIYPNQPIIVTMLYVNDGGPFSVYFDKKDLKKTENIIRYYFEKIKNTEPVCSKTWKCNKFCEYGTTTFENTKVHAIKHNQVLTKCKQVEYTLQHRTENDIVNNMSYRSLQ